MSNVFKKKMQDRHRMFGLFMVSNALQTAEALAGSGFDYLCFDLEHSPSSMPALHAQLTALASTPTASMVRLTGLNLAEIKHCLDLGVEALMIPNVHTPELARLAVEYTRYPTAGGIRGMGGTMRATRYGRNKQYYANAADNTCLVVQIESREGIRNLDAICAVPGVDMIFFGPTDLSADMGHLGQPGHDDVVRVIEQGIRRANALGLPAGVLAGDPDCQRYLDAGASLVILGSDLGLLVKGADTLAAKYLKSA